MVLIWTQFGVKHKNVNVKCKVRVMHRGDSSGSSSSAVSTISNLPFKTTIYYYILRLKRVEHSVSDVIEEDFFFFFFFFCGTGISVCPCLLLWIHSNAKVAQPIAAQDLGHWGGKDFCTPLSSLSRCVVPQLIELHGLCSGTAVQR